jgi:hypothetical protein
MEEDLIDELETQPIRKRPVFLTVICILTWIGCGLSLIAAVYGLYRYMNLLNTVRFGAVSVWGVNLKNMYTWQIWSSFASVVGCLLCTLGSFAMWKLRRWGFYVYIVGQVLPFSMGMFVGLQSARMDVSMISIALVSAVFPIGFIVMYALNLKYMRTMNEESL